MRALLFTLFSLSVLFQPPAGAATHTAILKITNPNGSASDAPVYASAHGSDWTQVYVEIPAKLYMDKGWLREDLHNLRFIDIDSGNLALAHWVPPKKDSNLRIDKLGTWLLVKDLAPGETETIRMEMVDGASYYANPRAGSDRTYDRTSYNAASSVFPWYSSNLGDWKWNATGGWTSSNVKFIDHALYSEDDIWGDDKSDADAKTGKEFILTLHLLKFYYSSSSEVMFYFLSQAPYDKPDELNTKNGYRLFIAKAGNYSSVSDDLHYSRHHFKLKLQRRTGSGGWSTRAVGDWYPYHNSRHRLDIKVSRDRVGLWINGRHYPLTARHGASVDAHKDYIREDSWTQGHFGIDRRGWHRCCGTDLNYLTLRRLVWQEPTFELYGDTDLVIGQGSPDLGQDVVEIAPNLQRIHDTVGGNSLDDYVFAVFNIAHQDQIIDDFKLKLRNRGSAAETFDLTIHNSAPDDWLLYLCDSGGGSCSATLPATATLAAGAAQTWTLRLVPTPSALFNGSRADIDVRVEARGDGSFDAVRYSTRILTQLGCFWHYKAPQSIAWSGGHGYDKLNDYQVLVKIRGEATLSNARADGADVLFTDAQGNLLDFWIKSFDRAHGNLDAWVKVPGIPVGGGDIYAWWGNPEYSTGRSDPQATFDLWEDWDRDYVLHQPIGCDDDTFECDGWGDDPHGWANVPTPDDDYNWWELENLGGSHVLQADKGGSHKSSDTGPYIHKGGLGWDHYEVYYRMHSGTYYQYGGGGTWGNPQYNPVYFNDAGNMWGMEFFADKYIFRPYAAGIDYVWQYQTYPRDLLGDRFPKRNHWYWVKVRVYKDKSTGDAQLRLRIARNDPGDVDDDSHYTAVGDFLAPPVFSLDYGEIGFGGWDSGFAFDDVRVRKYVEDAAGHEPSVTAGSVIPQDPRGVITLSSPQITAPILGGRPAYIDTETIPYAWRGDIKVYYADCYINGECQGSEDQAHRGTLSPFGQIDADTAKGAGWYLMRRAPGANNDSAGDPRRIYTTDGTHTDWVDFEADNCAALEPWLGTGGACDADDGTYDETERLVRFVRGFYVPEIPRSAGRNLDALSGYGDGDGVAEDTEQWKLGDLLHSSPLLVGVPKLAYQDDSYWDFVDAHDDRDLVAYALTNEGMLHAFRIARYDTDASAYLPDADMTELWAFIPHAVLPNLKRTTDADHDYLADGLLRAVDVNFGGGWRTVLFGGLGRGGLSYFALDVTDPAAPRLLWERAGDKDTSGTTLSAAALGKLDTDGDGEGDLWVAVLGSGWDTDYADNYEDKYAWLTVLNLETGAVVKKVRVSPKVGNVLTDITALRDAADGTLKTLYFGDYYGALWRVDGSRLGGSALADGATLDAATDMLFQPNDYATTGLPSAVARPITVRPRVAKGEGSEFWVYFGTGDYNEYEATYPHQAFYGLKDRADRYVGDAALVDMTSTASTNTSSDSWFLRLGVNDPHDYVLASGTQSLHDRNERVLRPAEVYGGFVFFTSFEPANLPCGGGKSRFYALNYRSGALESGLFQGVGAGLDEVRSVETADTGIPSQPMILEGQSGQGTAVAAGVTSSTSGGVTRIELAPDKFSTALDILLWREKR